MVFSPRFQNISITLADTCNRAKKLTLCLNARRSSIVSESDLAMTGTTLTTSESFLRTRMSSGLRLLFLKKRIISRLIIVTVPIELNVLRYINFKYTYAWPVGEMKNKQQ